MSNRMLCKLLSDACFLSVQLSIIHGSKRQVQFSIEFIEGVALDDLTSQYRTVTYNIQSPQSMKNLRNRNMEKIYYRFNKKPDVKPDSSVALMINLACFFENIKIDKDNCRQNNLRCLINVINIF